MWRRRLAAHLGINATAKALLCIMAALGGMLAWQLDKPLFVVAFAAEAGLAAYLSNAPI